MISRRNIRVKVMQTLYTLVSLGKDENNTTFNVITSPQKLLQNHFDQSRKLLIYLIHFLTEVARQSESVAHQRASKHLPSVEDLNVNTKIAGNEVMWKMLESPSYMQLASLDRPELIIDKPLLKKVFQNLEQSNEYLRYISTNERNNSDEKAILEFIFETHMLQNENFTSHLEDLFSNWEDDGESTIQVLMSFIHKPTSTDLREIVGKEKMEFAKTLLSTVLDKEEQLQTYIFPKLNNWDSDRIALLDMIIMKMGVAEFLFFETIPPKVTINEYIDISKDFSTNQSGQFVNGILDNIHKDLVNDGKLNKTDFKKA